MAGEHCAAVILVSFTTLRLQSADLINQRRLIGAAKSSVADSDQNRAAPQDNWWTVVRLAQISCGWLWAFVTLCRTKPAAMDSSFSTTVQKQETDPHI
jgi:hypothetical protein